MTSEVASKPYYKLGVNYFHVNQCNKQFHEQLEQLIPTESEMPENGNYYECNLGCGFDLRLLFNEMLKRHYIHVWLDAATLVSPSGKRVLLAGKSSSGKSTTTMALALAFGWKVLSEDITLIDPNSKTIVNFASPFSLKSGTSDLLKRTFDLELGAPFFGEWIPLGQANNGKPEPANFDLAIVFDLDKTSEFTVREQQASEITRTLLPYSNFVKKEGGMEVFLDCLSTAKCMHITNGTLEERIAKICELTGDKQNKVKIELPKNPVPDMVAPPTVPWKPVKPSTKKFRRHPDIQANLLPDGHLVLSDQESSWAYTLTPIGSLVWEFLDGNNTDGDIVRELRNIDEIPEIANLEEMVVALLADLEESGLLVD